MVFLEEQVIKTLDILETRFNWLNQRLIEPEVIDNRQVYLKLSKELNEIETTCRTYAEFKDVSKQLEGALNLVSLGEDEEIVLLAKEEVSSLNQNLSKLALRLKELLLPRDELEERDVIVEIRGAAGGEEANLFALDLFKIYQRWSEHNKWKVKLLDIHYSESGGASQLIFSVKGKGIVYGRLKFETGVHRVQRVPVTETMGRVHTSTVTVTIIPEVAEEGEVKIIPEEIKVDTYRSSGAGGQSVNTTDSAVRITHIPTNTVVTCQQSRSQIENKELAMQILRAKLLALQEAAANKVESEFRRMAGSGARAEKIRTYNWSQDRVTDHRVNISNSLKSVLEGKVDVFTDALIAKERAELLVKMTSKDSPPSG